MTLLPPQRVAEEAQASTAFPVQLPPVLPYAPLPVPVFQGPPHRLFLDPSRVLLLQGRQVHHSTPLPDHNPPICYSAPGFACTAVLSQKFCGTWRV
ncbi:hypothetical protein NDU88_004989 [Pleurodeles waltl]|uniref:Deleted in azoospermia-associated protein 2 n=1 Tax=Pleurodeles waltl TaxID=8319 RepID=A0AAV7VKN9_PLEWA|nr:hypothetical protein NDU88_004989 [Pleurodeles waltl]